MWQSFLLLRQDVKSALKELYRSRELDRKALLPTGASCWRLRNLTEEEEERPADRGFRNSPGLCGK